MISRLTVPILMYHRVTPESFHRYSDHDTVLDALIVTPDAFARQMQWLARWGYSALSLDDIYEARQHQRSLPRRSVVITFDDGYQDFVDYAVPVLTRYRFTAHIFLVAGSVGGESAWDNVTYGWSFPLFSWETARALESQGFHCDAHSMTHPRLGQLGPVEARREIVESRQVLQEELRRSVNHFAYPFGSYSAETQALVQQAGFVSACSTEGGLSPIHDDAYALRRICVHMSDSLLDFKSAVLTGHRVPSGIKRRLRRYLNIVRSRS